MALSSSELTFVFGLLGNIISFCVFLAPVPTFYQIFKKKSTEGFQSIPYVVALLSAMLWIYYALLKTNATFLITINTFGCFIELIYICFFLVYATKKARVDALKQIVGLLVCGFGLIVVLTYFLAHGATRVKAVGWTCLVFSLCVFVAPLCIVVSFSMHHQLIYVISPANHDSLIHTKKKKNILIIYFMQREVIRTKSAEYMPLPLSAFLTLNAVAWFFYGLLLKDFNIAVSIFINSCYKFFHFLLIFFFLVIKY
ncbi:OLC1v1013693C2 [Oldenlandia corymbosa var. corymbosa]|uniref:Bidirectional sugar transporter SWEET n=1 Tax=Oldenlandia corymbosa var. corymbosa TaxID=529605 RepID=A0AAV1E105_OLDCO|nr:OLC1v1013693C2 [Oldenlandia corymbosa var. corymbosa]